MFQSIGERFNIGVTYLLHRLKKCLKLEETDVSQTELTILGCVLCSCVLVGGAAAFHSFENWEFLDAFYYCFITMSTIGFGDYVALQNESIAALQTQPEYVAFCIIYILFGLTVFAAALNLMVLRLLTMNTEDERKDELEALAAARGAPKLDGDVIRPNANGHVATTGIEEGYSFGLSSHQKKKSWFSKDFIPLTTSCEEDVNLQKPTSKAGKPKKNRYSVKRNPSQIQHLLPMQANELPLIARLVKSHSREVNEVLTEEANEGSSDDATSTKSDFSDTHQSSRESPSNSNNTTVTDDDSVFHDLLLDNRSKRFSC